MRSEKLFRPFIRPMFNSHCGGIRLDEVSLMKRIGALLLCGILLLPAAGASGTPWPAWAAEALAWGREKSVSRAFLASPGQRLTRGAVARLLYESAGQPAAHEECPFSDVSEKDAAAVGWAAGQGYLTGVGDGTYEPGRPVTRQEFAAILWRQAGTPEVPVQGLERFGDAGTVSEWARDAVLWCQQAGVMAGRSGDKLAPEDTITTAEALVMLERAAGLPDVGQLRDDLEILAAHHRPVGSQGEADAVRYLRDRFEEMGYSVTLQPYTDGQGRTGHNVAAVKAASVPDADILVLSAHHDSVPTAYGANDNASGVAALLYTAEALRNVPTDTEVRFLSFTDEENGKNGSRTYTASLTEEERTRIVGAIQFDMLGGLGSTGTLVCTVDGEANWVSDLLQKKNPGLESGVETASDHTSFQLSGIPAVLLMQRGRGYLYHSAADTAEQLDLYAIVQNCVQTLQVNARNHNVSISAKGTGQLIKANRQMIEELVYNLCDNAIRYNKEGGKVEAGVARTREGVQLIVQDNGIGIPKEHQERIFERFYRVDKSRSKETGGTGLGLAIVKHIAQVHNASLEVISEEGQGTKILVTFHA